jgi:hypothetical protein
VISVGRKLSDGKEERSAGAMATFVCRPEFANSYHASAFKLWSLLEQQHTAFVYNPKPAMKSWFHKQ